MRTFGVDVVAPHGDNKLILLVRAVCFLDPLHVLLLWHTNTQQLFFCYPFLHDIRGCASFSKQRTTNRTHCGVSRGDGNKCFPSFFGGRAVAVAFQTNQTPRCGEWVPTGRRTGCLIGPACTLLTLKNSRGASSELFRVTHKIFLYIKQSKLILLPRMLLVSDLKGSVLMVVLLVQFEGSAFEVRDKFQQEGTSVVFGALNFIVNGRLSPHSLCSCRDFPLLPAVLVCAAPSRDKVVYCKCQELVRRDVWKLQNIKEILWWDSTVINPESGRQFWFFLSKSESEAVLLGAAG